MTMGQPIEDPAAGPNWWNRALLAIIWAAMLPGLYFAREFRYETFHDLVGVFCTVTAGAIFIV